MSPSTSPALTANSFAIAVSDEEEENSGRMRVHLRQKRKRPRSRRQHVLWRAFRLAMRWWPLLLFLPAIALLILESSRLGRKPQAAPQREAEEDSGSSHHRAGETEETPRNLNRLDPITRAAHGVREPCLKILSPETLPMLEFPETAEPNFPMKAVMYKSLDGDQYIGNNYTLAQHEKDTRFNIFTGYQTMHEREYSYKVNETAVVHCGFYSEKGGFRISEDDKSYMQTCKVVVSTCTFGGGDDLYQPIGMTESSLKKVCYVAFWDEITLSTQKEEGKAIGENHMIGEWRIVIVKDLPFSDQRLNGKIPKMLAHRLFPDARYSIWVDSKSQFRRDPIGVLEVLLWRTGSILAISEHGARSSLYDEGKAVVKKNKATPEEVELQLNQYRLDGIPDDKRLNGKKALAEASIIVREHTPLTNLFMCLWFNEVVRFTSRDQLSFPYVLRRLKMPGINMFPVCTRKDLVNSIGHKRKAKPLTRQLL